MLSRGRSGSDWPLRCSCYRHGCSGGFNTCAGLCSCTHFHCLNYLHCWICLGLPVSIVAVVSVTIAVALPSKITVPVCLMWGAVVIVVVLLWPVVVTRLVVTLLLWLEASPTFILSLFHNFLLSRILKPNPEEFVAFPHIKLLAPQVLLISLNQPIRDLIRAAVLVDVFCVVLLGQLESINFKKYFLWR